MSQLPFAYLYDHKSKQEIFGEVDLSNPKELNSDFGKDYVTMCFHAKKKLTRGKFLSEILSIIPPHDAYENQDPKKQISKIQNSPIWLEFPFSFWKNQEWDNGTLAHLFEVRKYIDNCIKNQNLFTLSGLYYCANLTHPADTDNSPFNILGLVYPQSASPDESIYLGYKYTKYYFEGHPYPLYRPHIPALPLDELKTSNIISQADLQNNASDPPVYEIYNPSCLIDALLCSLFHLIQNRVPIKQCANCGKYFVPNKRSDTKYCDSPSPQDSKRSCRKFISEKGWYERLKNDDVIRLSRNVYSAKQMLVRRHPDDPEYKEMFEYFKAERNKWRAQLKNGSKSQEQYVSWLHEIKQYKTLSDYNTSSMKEV